VNLGGNPNILKGFDYLSDADYLWICSDDELLRPNALSDVFAHLQAQPGIDVLSLSQVARTQDSVETIDPTQALDQLNIAGFGLISLVIYRSAWVQPHVRAGHDKLLSCFPHLAVFFEAVRKTGQSRFLFVSVDSLFFPGGRKNAPADSDAYLLAHYGFVMLAECFDGELRKTFCSRWWKVHSVHAVAKARLAPAHSGACFGILRRHLPFFRTRYALARVRVPIWLLRQSFERRLVALYRSPRAKHPALKIPLEKLKNWYRKVLGQV
jgi:hypothetical protein